MPTASVEVSIVGNWLIPIVPTGKRCDVSLREQEKQIRRDLEDGISTHNANSKTLNDIYDTYIECKTENIPQAHFILDIHIWTDMVLNKIIAISI